MYLGQLWELVKVLWMTHLSATFTHVGLLSSMYSLMNSQSRTLDELLAAVWIVADMWPHSGVDALCHLGLVRWSYY
jgi:hypothetical protein